MAASPTQRTLQILRATGWLAAVAEYWNPHSRRRFDLFGFIDIVAVHPQEGILAVQATNRANHAARRKKILCDCQQAAESWLRAGGRIQIISWAKLVDGWTARVDELTVADFAETLEQGTASDDL